jgi:CRP-like cAMP-binding protein
MANLRPGIGHSGNRVLDALPRAEREAVLSQVHTRPIAPREMLVGPGQPMREVYFPTSGVISLMTALADGSAVEVATVGPEGMVGVHEFLGGGILDNSQATSQVPGEMLVMPLAAFRAEAAGDGRLPDVMRAYTRALFSQISQAVACNGVHEVHRRVAKWLLQTHDRVQGDSFRLTQEFLADMLGVTRPSVSVAASNLQSAGLIRYRRGVITILDRPGLEKASCECYGAVIREYDRAMAAA